MALSGCASAVASDAPAPIVVTQATLDQCLETLATQAIKADVSTAAFRLRTNNLKPDPAVINSLNFQPEFISSVADYLKSAVSDQRVTTGRAMLVRHAELLTSLEEKYGIPREVLTAVWGIESNFGQNFGKRSVVQSLATLACHGRRQAFFRRELFATVQLLEAGHVNPDKLVGSWAGAFGHTQFMPTTFLTRAVDYDGDGRSDLVENLGDALASTANYLKVSGWQPGLPWGIEVTAPPAGVNATSDSRTTRKPLSAWRDLGIRGIDQPAMRRIDALPGDAAAALIRPADNAGPTLLVLRNFDAIYAYNPSVKYSLAVAHLSDRLADRPGFIVPWPDVGAPLTLEERRELQALLLGRGHRIGKIDGILGSRTRAAIRIERGRMNNPNLPGERPVLEALRQQPR
ncbi:MAG: lytic murein transglycosylase [Burkholderiaceae bacterium]